MPVSNVPPTVPHPSRGELKHSLPRYDSLLSLLRAPVARQALLFVGVSLAVALGLAVVLWSRSPDFSLLYAGLAPKDASNIVQVLESDNIPYKLSSDGTGIFVPASRVASVRLSLASRGLPEGTASSVKPNSAGFAFGMSDAAEAVQDRQMLEQELDRTIASLQSVRSASVQLAIPKPSEFIRDDSHPSASVLVTLYPGRTLSRSQVTAIVHLVATSVSNLDPSRVAVVDQQGDLLTSTEDDSASSVGDRRMRLTARIEGVYAAQIERILAPIVGASHVRAMVHVDLDFSSGRKASEVYGTGPEALLSEQESEKERAGPGSGLIAGALSNQPPLTVPQPTAANPNAGGPVTTSTSATQAPSNGTRPVVVSSNATRNYDVNRTITYVANPAGDVARLTAAVVVDDRQAVGKEGKVKEVPLGTAELASLTSLVKGTIGFNAARGDVVSVVNEPFEAEPPAGAQPAEQFWQEPEVRALLRQAAAVIAVLLLAFLLLRPVLKGLIHSGDKQIEIMEAPPALTPIEAKPHVEEIVDELSKGRDAPEVPIHADYEHKMELARRVADKDPRQIAQIVTNWMSSDGN